ncbi:MAG: Cof-type HAD-IIB family hydrolase [Sporolactobacillus sp.]
MKNIHTIMLDLDGTALKPDNTMPAELTAYLRELHQRGHVVFVVSGRSRFELSEVLPADFPARGMVTANGMAVYAEGTKIYQSLLPDLLARRLISDARKWRLYYEIYPLSGGRLAFQTDRTYMQQTLSGVRPPGVRINEWLSRLKAARQTTQWVESLDESTWQQIFKIYFFSTQQGQMDDWKHHLEQLGKDESFGFFSSSPNSVEVNTTGVSKASGLELLFKHYGLDREESLCIGDGENDLPMFDFAGHAVAMKNALPTIIQHADEVTAFTNAENGVYRYLRQLFG